MHANGYNRHSNTQMLKYVFNLKEENMNYQVHLKNYEMLIRKAANHQINVYFSCNAAKMQQNILADDVILNCLITYISNNCLLQFQLTIQKGAQQRKLHTSKTSLLYMLQEYKIN